MNRKSNWAPIGAVLTVGAVWLVFALSIIRKLKPVLCPLLVLAGLSGGLCQASLGQGDADLEAPGLAPFPTPSAGGPATLFQNVRIFDGKSAALSAPSNVLVRDNTIERISVSPITVDTNANVTRHCGERARADARPHRRALAFVHGGDAPDAPHDRRVLTISFYWLRDRLRRH